MMDGTPYLGVGILILTSLVVVFGNVLYYRKKKREADMLAKELLEGFNDAINYYNRRRR